MVASIAAHLMIAALHGSCGNKDTYMQDCRHFIVSIRLCDYRKLQSHNPELSTMMDGETIQQMNHAQLLNLIS